MMRQEKIKKGLAFLLALVLILGAYVIAVLPEKAGAYNFPWDQGHDCVNTVNPDGTWGRYDYNGRFDGKYETKECCELLCKICPVYSNTGQLQKSYTDLSVPGVGPALNITRTYNSQNLSTSLLGRCWVFNFGRRLIIGRKKSGEKVIGVLQETGEKNFFKEEANGTLTLLAGYGVTYSLTKNTNGAYTIKELDGTVREMNADGKIKRIVDNNGNALTFTYDAVGCLSKIINASGNYVTIQLGANGKIANISDNLGRTVSYSYNSSGDLASSQDPLGNTTQYTYDSKHRLTKITDPRGNVVLTAAYNTDNKVSSFMEKGETYTIAYYSGYTTKKDSKGNTWTYYFNDVGVIEKVIDPLGNVKEQHLNKVTTTSVDWEKDLNGNLTAYTYDGKGNVTSKTDPLGNTTAYTYVPGTNLVATETDPQGVVNKYEYDAKGNRTKIIRDFGGPLQNVTTYAYDSKGNQTSFTDPLGHITRYEYDANGNLIKEIDPLGRVTAYTYDSRGNKLTETDANGNVTSYTYDLMDRLVSVTYASGNTAVNSYDANGNLVSFQAPDGSTITYAHDAYDRLILETYPTGKTWGYTYDKNNKMLTATDANGNTTTYTYDQLGRRTRITDSLGNKTNFVYDANGNLKSVTDANGNTTSFMYDTLNRIIKKTYPDGKSYEYAYDIIGNKITQKDVNGNTINFAYDRLRRLISKAYPDGSSTNYTYDGLGRVLTGVNADSNLAYSYDALGRMLQATLNGKTISYNYDAVGNRVSMSTPEGKIIQYTYNNVNMLSRIQIPNGKGISYKYDKLDRISRKDFSGGCYSTYAYDSSGRLTQIKHLKSDDSELYYQINTFDHVGNMTSKTTSLGTTNYTYDKLYQLIGAHYPDQPQENFTYDPVGNRLTSTDYNNWSYNKRNQLISYDNVSFTYDFNGNAIIKTSDSGITQYIYDYENRLTRINLPDGGYMINKYDVEGRRIETDVNGNVTKYIYDGNLLLAEYDSLGSLRRNYFYGFGDVTPSILYENTSTYFYHHDYSNTPYNITDESGNIVWEATYKSFGEANITTENVTNNFRFPGQYYDAESELYYNRARYYHKSIGRYLSEDADGIYKNNLYYYVENNPLNKIDPSGLRVQICKRPLALPWWVDIIGPSVLGLLYIGFRAHAKHCDIKITTKSNWGFYGTNNIQQNPGGITSDCQDAIKPGNDKDCFDECVNNAAAASQLAGANYNFFTFNCCHWAHSIVKSCGLEFPFPNINWPCNPGS